MRIFCWSMQVMVQLWSCQWWVTCDTAIPGADLSSGRKGKGALITLHLMSWCTNFLWYNLLWRLHDFTAQFWSACLLVYIVWINLPLRSGAGQVMARMQTIYVLEKCQQTTFIWEICIVLSVCLVGFQIHQVSHTGDQFTEGNSVITKRLTYQKFSLTRFGLLRVYYNSSGSNLFLQSVVVVVVFLHPAAAAAEVV